MHLTYRDPPVHTRAFSPATPAGETGAPEIEITPEMVEAGVLALSEYSSFFDLPADGVEKIYRAMEAARLDRTKNYVGGV